MHLYTSPATLENKSNQITNLIIHGLEKYLKYKNDERKERISKVDFQ